MQAVFLDREGVITPKLPSGAYILQDEQAILDSAVCDALAPLVARGIKLFIVSNQSCVRRGLLVPEECERLHDIILSKLSVGGVLIEDSAICPHTDEDGCDCRKPKPGMILNLCKKHGIDPSETAIVGDSIRDVQAGVAAGCRAQCLLTSPMKDEESLPHANSFANLSQAVQWLLSENV